MFRDVLAFPKASRMTLDCMIWSCTLITPAGGWGGAGEAAEPNAAASDNFVRYLSTILIVSVFLKRDQRGKELAKGV